ncbi:MAG: cell division protein ZapD [Burkholderiaceae bacterium]|nr:cell division protein ZapD [Burkholderiaceae bacterium]
MILYEYPFNERIRTYLRLEHLLRRLGELLARQTPLDHHFALITLFEIVEVAGRSELKPDLMRDLDRHKSQLAAFRGNPAVSEATLEQALQRIDHAFTGLVRQPGKVGGELLDHEWLTSVRSRAAIPAGTCSFDLPAYHAWQHRSAKERLHELHGWAQTLAPMGQAVQLLLQLLRESGRAQRVMAQAGQYQQNLPAGRSFQLLRLSIDGALGLLPEISGNRLMVAIRLLRQDEKGKLGAAKEDTVVDLTLCA